LKNDFVSVFGLTDSPPVIAASRPLFTELAATNVFGQKGPAIAATDAKFVEMWAQEAGDEPNGPAPNSGGGVNTTDGYRRALAC